MLRSTFSSIVVLLSITALSQELAVPRFFSNHMVLQRDQPVRLWGWAAPGEEIRLAIDAFEITARADKQGKWECLYPSHPAGGPFEITIKGGGEISISDVYFGDVWVAGGQSNMEWKIGWKIGDWEEEIKDSDFPQIRFFEVPNDMAVTYQHDIKSGEWKIAGPDNAAEFSAIAWFFAKLNHLEKGVPVGIIDSNWGGTPAESWASAERLAEVEGYQQAAGIMLSDSIDWTKRMGKNQKRDSLKWTLVNDSVTFLTRGAHQPDFDDSEWNTVMLPNQEPFSDFVWVRKSLELKNPKSGRLYLGDIEQICRVFINGVQVAEETWQDTTSVISIPEKVLKNGTNTIAIRSINTWNNQVRIGRKGEMWLESRGDKINLEGEWKFSNSVEPEMPEVEFFHWRPGILFNAMIYPIAGYTIAGAIWYQGESNTDKPGYYNELFETMIQDWRVHWKQGSFPFLFVQLANYMARQEAPSESGWAELREAQTQTLELPNTGMATIIDIGDAEDIHPRNKQDVGKRLWLAARKVVFDEDVIYSGPTYRSHEIRDGKVIVSFSHTEGGLTSKGDDPVGFAIADEDKKFSWAEATIRNDQIVLESEKVENPKYVRYAWADNPAVNLYNKAGLPAVPFRTDK